MGVSLNAGTPKSSILIGFSIINHPFWGTTIFGNTHIYTGHHASGGVQESYRILGPRETYLGFATRPDADGTSEPNICSQMVGFFMVMNPMGSNP